MGGKMADSTKGNLRRARGRFWRWLVWSATAVTMLVGLVGAIGIVWAGRVPAWYLHAAGGVDEEAIRQAENKLVTIQAWAAARHAYESAKQFGQPKATEPSADLSITWTEQEINGLLEKWYGVLGKEQVNGGRLEDVLRRPKVLVRKDGLTLAGTSPMFGGRFVSIELKPQIREGQLEVSPVSVHLGTLAMPQAAWRWWESDLAKSLDRMAQKQAAKAEFDRGGAANPATMTLTLAQQGRDLLTQETPMNVLFVPLVAKNAGVPVALEQCELEERSMTIKARVLVASERENLLHRTRAATMP